LKRNYSKHDNIKNYFPVPNEVFILGLKAGEILVYSYLLYCEDRNTYKCYPSYTTIGNAVEMSKNTVRKYVRSLRGKCLIYTEPTTVKLKDGRYHNGNLLYTIRPIYEAVDYFDRQQMRKIMKNSAIERAQKAVEKYDQKHGKSTII